jgi:hypothetical protein
VGLEGAEVSDMGFLSKSLLLPLFLRD